MLLSGMSLELAVVFFETAKQQQVPEHLIGRVTSLTMLGENALVPLGYVLAGSVADRLGASTVMWTCALGILLTNVILLFVPSVVNLQAISPSEPAREGEVPPATGELKRQGEPLSVSASAVALLEDLEVAGARGSS